MDIHNLVGMANQIGEFFESMPDRQEATADIALHISKFWEPRMRRALLSHLDLTDGDGLLQIVRDAILSNRQKLEPLTTVLTE